jgi:hypothetical protein
MIAIDDNNHSYYYHRLMITDSCSLIHLKGENNAKMGMSLWLHL